MSKYLVYSLWISIVILVFSIMLYNINKKGKIKLIPVNPINVIIGILFWGAIWLVDVTTLAISERGINTTVGLIPQIEFQAPAIETYVIMISYLFIVFMYFFIDNRKRTHQKFQTYNYILLITMLLGLIVLLISSLILIFQGHNAIINILGKEFYVLGIYHATLPILLSPISILILEIK